MRMIGAAAIVGSLLTTCAVVAAADSPLPAWNETAPKRAILDFVAAVSNEASADFVPIAERIAVFDNDGTLWAEQPVYVQVLFVVDRVKALLPRHPEWNTEEPFASLLKGDMSGVTASGEAGIAALMAATHADMTTDEFSQIVSEWLTTAKHPTKGKRFTEMVYQPMIELLAYLRENGFKTFIVSGGGVEFMRPWAERVYGIPPEQVVGSTGGLKWEVRSGRPVLTKLPTLVFNNDQEGKPVGIQRHIGRRPIAAFGNSDGDLQMLQWTGSGAGPRFCLYVHHTDAQREWAYDRQSQVGRLDRGLDEAKVRGWTIVSMKDDWRTIFKD